MRSAVVDVNYADRRVASRRTVIWLMIVVLLFLRGQNAVGRADRKRRSHVCLHDGEFVQAAQEHFFSTPFARPCPNS